MSGENTGASTTAGAALSPQELSALRNAEWDKAWDAAKHPGARGTEPPPAGGWPAGNVTGAFVSAAASIRHEVQPYSWWNVSWSAFTLYGLFVGLPALAGVWAVIEVIHRS